MNLKHKKHEEDYLKSHLNQLLKTSGKEKILRMVGGGRGRGGGVVDMSHTEKQGQRKPTNFLIETMQTEGKGAVSLKILKEESVNLESYTQQKWLLKMKL